MMSPYDELTPEAIKAEMLQGFQAKGVEIDTREGSYTNNLVSVAAYQLWKLYQTFPRLLIAAFPDETAGEFLDRAAAQVGLRRRPGTRAAVELLFTGEDGTRIPAGTVVYTAQGLRYRLTADAAIAGGRAAAAAEAEELGADYNVPAGAITALYENLPGVTTVTNPESARGGSDEESDADLFARYHERLALPITSGNANHYIHWAKEVPGVAYATCTPLWNGNGTVLVTIGGADRGPLDEEIRARTAAHIEAERPIGATVTVKSVVRRELPVSATVTLMAGATTESVRQQLTEAVSRMLVSLDFGTAQTVPYSRFLACLLSCPGVADYSAFNIDGKSGAVTLSAQDAPVVGTVTVR